MGYNIPLKKCGLLQEELFEGLVQLLVRILPLGRIQEQETNPAVASHNGDFIQGKDGT
jgi:hypothetical protein